MFKNKATANVALLFTFISVAVASVAVVKRTTQNDPFLTTSSPKGIYRVSFIGQQSRPKVPFVSNEVVFSVTKNGSDFLKNKYFHSGDWLDPSFDLLYPQHQWRRDDLVHFYRQEYFNQGERESIVVENKTRKVIPYLRVTSVDSFLMFEIQPGASSTLVVSAPRTDNRWVNVEGEFLDGKKIKNQGVGFLFKPGQKGPFAYYICINEDDLTIESPELEKYK